MFLIEIEILTNKYKKILFIFLAIIIVFFIYIFNNDKIVVYNDFKTHDLNISELNMSWSNLFIDIKWKWYKWVEIKIYPYIDLKNDLKIEKVFWEKIFSELKNKDIDIYSIKDYKTCLDWNCDLNYKIPLKSIVLEKIIDKYLYLPLSINTNLSENEKNQIVMMNATIKESCFWWNINYPSIPQCEIKNIQPILKWLKIEVAYYYDNWKKKIKTLNY